MYSNKKGTLHKSFKQTHSARALKRINESIVENIPIAPLIIDVNQERINRDTLEILFEFQKNKNFLERFDNYYVRQRFDFEMIKIQMIKCKNKTYKFNLRIDWFNLFGKYFLLRSDQG